MSGICSKHQHHSNECPMCEEMPELTGDSELPAPSGSVAALKYCELCHTEHHPHSPETCGCNCCKLSKNFVRLPKREELELTEDEKNALERLLIWQELSAKSPIRLGGEMPPNAAMSDCAGDKLKS